MGGSQTKCQTTTCREVKMLREKAAILQQKLDEMMCLREAENQAHDQEIMVHALKESEWKQERKWLQREVKRLKIVQENTIKREMMETKEAVDKWKNLYLAIKIELDNLINKSTHQGGCCREDGLEELRGELRAKDETIQLLQEHIASIEQQRSRREREVDILRQSLRIINLNNKKMKKKPKLLQN